MPGRWRNTGTDHDGQTTILDCAGSNISAIHVHPDGTRFVTAGFDNKTKVWNLVPALNPLQEGARGAPRLLATLTDHFAAVNVARFSRCNATELSLWHPLVSSSGSHCPMASIGC